MSVRVVATLNVADSNCSPFEYHDNSPEIKWLDTRFSARLQEQLEDGDNLQAVYQLVTLLDRDYSDQRFSPFYNGATQRFVDTEKEPAWQEFHDSWFRHHGELIRKEPGLEVDFMRKSKVIEKQKLHEIYESCAKFDYAMVLTLRDLKAESKSQVFSRQTLNQFIIPKSQLRIAKMKLVCAFLQREHVDLMMIQEMGEGTQRAWIDMLDGHGYELITNTAGNTGIILRKNDTRYEIVKMPESDTELHRECITVRDSKSNILYMSVHFSSKSAVQANSKKNYENQWQAFGEYLETQLRHQTFASYVIGGDLNHHPVTKPAGMSMFPPSSNQPTTRKQRTTMQSQFRKINHLDEGCKDHIITNGSIECGSILTLSGPTDPSMLLPHQSHPCDHFISMAKVHLPQ